MVAIKISKMDLKSAIAIILKDLGEARAIIEELKSNPGAPVIQLELARGKCRNAEEVLKLLSEMEFATTKSASTGEVRVEKPAEPTEDIVEPMVETPDPLPEVIDELIEEDEKVDEATLIDEIIQPPDKKDNSQVTPKEEKKSGKIVADTFRPKSGINERMAGGRSDSLSTDASRLKPVEDLSKAIGINDRFLFVREIFRGDASLYNDTISRLNSVTSVDEADEIIESVRDRQADRSAADQLLDLVRRKLSKL